MPEYGGGSPPRTRGLELGDLSLDPGSSPSVSPGPVSALAQDLIWALPARGPPPEPVQRALPAALSSLLVTGGGPGSTAGGACGPPAWVSASPAAGSQWPRLGAGAGPEATALATLSQTWLRVWGLCVLKFEKQWSAEAFDLKRQVH